MKYIYLGSYAAFLGIIIFLMFDANHRTTFPFGGPHQASISKVEESGDRTLYEKDPFYVGYRANNNYRQTLGFIGVGISVTGVLGWLAIRNAEKAKIRPLVAQDPQSPTP
ncbi:MAG: hypothetical protein ABIS50_16815 [Luteolibacter sp.]|uniref:hypothetical protein n=1 Tax=Luteolibacter sp. TaxID=1962973 RepID=UPI003264EFF9